MGVGRVIRGARLLWDSKPSPDSSRVDSNPGSTRSCSARMHLQLASRDRQVQRRHPRRIRLHCDHPKAQKGGILATGHNGAGENPLSPSQVDSGESDPRDRRTCYSTCCATAISAAIHPLGRAARAPRCGRRPSAADGERLELLRWVGLQVDVGGLRAGVAEPQRNLAQVARRLQRVERAGMPQRRDTLGAEGRAPYRGLATCLASTRSKPERVIGRPQALRSSSGAGPICGLTAVLCQP